MDRSRDIWGQMGADALAVVTGIDWRCLTGARLSASAIPPRCLVGLSGILEDRATRKAIGAFVLVMGYLPEEGVECDGSVAAYQRWRESPA